ncbi:hypothetical protein PENSPDRAFT_440487 [Peniophora sp. CONT]|nr:hypothetical protein PENSPDRAFT_440487 [Peniophora sp. CONT]
MRTVAARWWFAFTRRAGCGGSPIGPAGIFRADLRTHESLHVDHSVSSMIDSMATRVKLCRAGYLQLSRCLSSWSLENGRVSHVTSSPTQMHSGLA